jgi:hypothetical protein
MEFFILESPATEIPWNFSSWSLWQQKFHGIFRPGVSGNRNSMEFFVLRPPARKFPTLLVRIFFEGAAF